MNLHQTKLKQVSKPGDIKMMAKTIEFELERKKNEKLKNHEFNNQGTLAIIKHYRAKHPDKPRQSNLTEQAGRHLSRKMGRIINSSYLLALC